MTTRQLLEMYTDSNEKGRKELLELHQDNKRFVSLVELRNEFLEGFEKFLMEKVKEKAKELTHLIHGNH